MFYLWSNQNRVERSSRPPLFLGPHRSPRLPSALSVHHTAFRSCTNSNLTLKPWLQRLERKACFCVLWRLLTCSSRSCFSCSCRRLRPHKCETPSRFPGRALEAPNLPTLSVSSPSEPRRRSSDLPAPHRWSHLRDSVCRRLTVFIDLPCGASLPIFPASLHSSVTFLHCSKANVLSSLYSSTQNTRFAFVCSKNICQIIHIYIYLMLGVLKVTFSITC